MNLNADFTARAAIHAARLPWVPSPTPGVERRMLDRVGGEVARATSIVRYAPGSQFPPHTHGGGEEILVLDGVFSDETGDFPAGTYLRNPPGSRHRPGSAPGCTLLVKLWQMDPGDRATVRCDWACAPPERLAAGVESTLLFGNDEESVRVERWAPGAVVDRAAPGGLELLVLEGGFDSLGEPFEPLSWLRRPDGDRLCARAGAAGCRVWLKSGHLARVRGLAAAGADHATPG